MWEIRIKQYFQIQDYALWEVIENGNSWVAILVTTPPESGTSTTTKMTLPATIKETTCKKNDVKARTIKTRFGGNEATKKTQKALLKQQYENFSASSSESLDSIFNRLQKLVSRLAILGVVTPPEDLNVKFLRSLPSEWDTHVVVWMNKPDFDTMGLDDLYNNFKIVEQKVKKSAGASNDDKNLAFVTTLGASSTNNINTVNPEVSTTTTKVNTASTEICTARFSDATVYAFLSTQPKGSQLVHEDLEQLHDDDLEEMDLKWNMALLSMRARKFYQRTGRKIIIDGSNTAGYDKSKVECFNCHRMGHFARECRAPRSKDNRNWNQGSSTKAVKIEDASEKAMCAIDGAGFDWSDMAEEEIQANMALMAFSDSEVTNDKSCSKSCLKNYEALKKQYDDLLVKLDDTGFKAATYKRGLATLEDQIIKYREHEVLFSEEIALLKRSVGHKEYQMGLLRDELEKVKQEKEGFEFKIAKFDKSAKDLSEMLESQITDKSKKGVGYHAVPSPHPLILNRPTPLDLSYSGLEEFKEPEVNEYGPRDSSLKPTIGCDKESDNSKENTDDSLEQHQITDTETSSVKSSLKVDKDWKEKFFYPANHVREVEPKKVRENNDAPIIEDWVSDDEDDDEPNPKVEKKTVIPTATKKEFVKPEKPVKCLTRAKQVQPALYNGHVLVMSNHARPVVHDSEDTREIAEITRKRMLLKMQSPLYDNARKKAETSVPKPISALTVYPPNTPVKLVPRVLPTKSQVKINLYVLTQLFTEFDKTCKKRITPTGVTEGERGFEQTKRCYLTEVIPFFITLKEHFVGVQTALFKEVKVMEEIFDQMNNEVDKNTVDKQCAEIVKKNLLIENENLIANCLSNQLLYDVEKSRCLDLEAEMSKEAPDFNSFFKIKNLEHQIQEKDNVIRDLKVLVANVNDRSCVTYNAKDVTALIEQNDCVRVELEKVKQHYKELYDSIKITRAHTSEKTSTMLNEIESLKAQLRSKESCFTSDYVKPKVLTPDMYSIDVKPIPHPLKNNRSAHLNYISHLKESVETVREIVEEARVVKPLDNALNYACQYTKLSQELLEYVIGTCPKSFNERDNKAPSTPVTRKKQVTFSDKPGTSSSNTQKHEVHQKVQQTNIPVIPSTGVNASTEASGSKPRSNTKKNRILPAKKENKKKVEVHLRTNKSVWTKVNRIDSSISYKRVVINSNSESVCKMCDKCLNSANHEMCVVNILSSVNATPTVKRVLNKGKQIWKPKGKLSDNRLNKTKRVWKATGKLFADIGYQWRPTGKKFALGEMCPLTKLSVKCRTGHPLVSGLRLFKTYDGESFKAHEFCGKVHRDSQIRE
ncbi:integrase, catalytic region, zinc finger, CCHC-type containing protein [Tanacetum coccineum]